MLDNELKLLNDIKKIQQISIIPTLLEVICRSTGMGFAAVARVTQLKWIACSVRDEIEFGLIPGGELKIETTICNEIRDHHQPVIIDNVDNSKEYCNHHTPRMYGFQSYISIPIIQKNGEFFGTLCAIDPKPALINNPKTVGMFNLFAELISYHLASLELIERTDIAVQELNKQLSESVDENRQYQFISNHNLQEPLRKLRVFSDILAKSLVNNEIDKAKNLAFKINASAQKISMMIQDLSDFKKLEYDDLSFELVNLNKIVTDVCSQLNLQLKSKNAVVNIEKLPVVHAIPSQLEQLFFYLFGNAIKFSKKETPLLIRVYCASVEDDFVNFQKPENNDLDYADIRIEDNGIGIEKIHLEKIFDIFSKMNEDQYADGEGIGLAYCRKIVRNHRGFITAKSEPGKGTIFCILLPVNKK